MYKLSDTKNLKRILYTEDYDRIIFWRDGTWNLVTSSYSGEQSGDNPIYYISRGELSGMTTKEDIDEFVDHYLIFNIEDQIRAIDELNSIM